MKKQLLTIVFISLTSLVLAQKKNTENKPRPDTIGYYMRNDRVMAYNEADAQFIRFIIKADSGMFKISDYYRNGHLRLVTKTAIDSANFEHGAQGICYEYYNTGKRKSIKIYNKGQIVGDAVTYYPNGGLYNVINHSAGQVYLKQCLDTAGNVLADNGNGKWIDFDNLFESKNEGHVINGIREGEWMSTKANGKIITGVYKNGTLISGDMLTNDMTVYEKVETPPEFEGGRTALYKYLAKNIRYPAIARENNVQGRLLVGFIVERDGSIRDVKLVRGMGSGCDEEAMRVVALSPSWKPGYHNGIPVRVRFTILIEYFLNDDGTAGVRLD